MSSFTAYEIQQAICRNLVSAEVALLISQRCGAKINAMPADSDDSDDTLTLLITYPDESFLLATVTDDGEEYTWAIGAFRTRELLSQFLHHGAKESDAGLYDSIAPGVLRALSSLVETPMLDSLKDGHFHA